MKKVIALCLMLVLCVSLSSCAAEKLTIVGTYSAWEGYQRFVFEEDGTLTWYAWGDTGHGTYEKDGTGWKLQFETDDGRTGTGTATINADGELVIKDGNLTYYLERE